MTNEKEAPEWYEDGKYWVPQPERYGHHWPKLNEIVAEAMRRGEVKALEESRKSIESSHLNACGNPQLAADATASVKLFKMALIRRIDAKLKSLT